MDRAGTLITTGDGALVFRPRVWCAARRVPDTERSNDGAGSKVVVVDDEAGVSALADPRQIGWIDAR